MPLTKGPVVPVHWVQAGSGQPLVLLHGLGGDVGFWESEIAALSGEFHVIAVDLRGSGATPASAGGHTMHDLADDVAAVLDDLEIASAHVLGFSMGGNVAQAFALRHPERLDRLVLASTFAAMNPQARMFLDAVLDVYQQGTTAKQMFDLICPWLFSVPFLADPARRGYFVYPDNDPNEQPMDDWRKLYLAQQAFDVRDRLAAITAPTLVLAGQEDRLVSLCDAQALSDGIPGARLHVLPHVGHLLNVEAAGEFLAATREHLSSAP